MAVNCASLDNGVENSMHWTDTRSVERNSCFSRSPLTIRLQSAQTIAMCVDFAYYQHQIASAITSVHYH